MFHLQVLLIYVNINILLRWLLLLMYANIGSMSCWIEYVATLAHVVYLCEYRFDVMLR